MTQSDGPGTPALEAESTDTFHAAVGLPMGVTADPESGETAGAVRRGGELVSLDPAEYGLWFLLLSPMTRGGAVGAAATIELADPEAALATLEDRDLLVTIIPGASMHDDLARLRPLPLGVALGNLEEHGKFEIQNSSLTLTPPISVDPTSMMLWSEFDGTTSLRDSVLRVASWLPEFSSDLVESAVTRLVHGLMTHRLLHLDVPRAPIGAGRS